MTGTDYRRVGTCYCPTILPHPATECLPFGMSSTEVQQRDLGYLLRTLSLDDGPRPYSPHAVIHRDVLPAIESLAAKVARVEAIAAKWEDYARSVLIDLGAGGTWHARHAKELRAALADETLRYAGSPGEAADRAALRDGSDQ